MNIYKIISLVFCLFFIFSCSKSPKQKQMPPVPVVVAETVLKDVPVQITAIGNVEAYSSVTIKSRVEGQLIKANFKEGDEVKKGQLLFVIDPRPFEEAVRQAEANLLRDKAQLDFARADLERYDELLKEELVSRQQYEKIRTTYESLKATVKADQAILDNARLQLSYCYIYSPIDGKIGSLLVHPGNMIKANDTQIAVINQIVPILARFSVPEQELFRIKKAMSQGSLKTEVVVKGIDSNYTAEGRVVFIDNAVDVATGTVKLKAEFPNKDKMLWPGQFVNVVLTLGVKKNAVIIPYRALQTGQKGQYVWVIKEDKTAQMREVTPGLRFGDEVTIEKGLSQGEIVVVDGQLKLTPNAKVEIKK
ncbi:RND efflux system, membrane fusion protein CmeA [Thermodesulfovibrio sp. N1]|uniref:efflux RND transporter periplasmic adaptor subunit n=2 Tax=unclassified Thermodesulfovibrio TaxID=2645936 RepID=UPI00083AA202|nr:efflux RND transporter periplasmic adaptor subunit [Thermodesulfovibrio sp. 1176]MDI1472494.1 efflux RND transporter periplasmic adaptor subunit [Thermodesulfovibrio sp. 1176]ODA43881.1 RND efflux system, membrane fusion protein CmeA [Thermodesulfovibrio sp. N1]